MRSWLNARRARAAETPAEPDLRAAYQRGRRDERARHRQRPVLALVVAGTALVGGAALALAAIQGSFQSGGEIMDRQLATAADRAEPVLRDMAGDARQTLRTGASDGQAGG